MPITRKGWELLVTRLGIHKRGAKQRTYASYQVFIDGKAVEGLGGNLCECIGPGSTNSKAKPARRIPAGRYPLSTQFGTKYRTIGFSTITKPPGKQPLPGILLMDTKPRSAILIHPGHPPGLYLSSIGCLNPTAPLKAKDDMDFIDSRTRAIALIDSLNDFAHAAFAKKKNTPIPNAFAVIDGEPMDPVP